jgi:hypothetical protein
MSHRYITLLTVQDHEGPILGPAGALVECALDAPWLPAGRVPIAELLGSWEEAKKKAAKLVLGLLEGEPEIEGVRHLYALKEIFIRAAMQHQLVLNLDNWLREHQIERCIFRAHSTIADPLKQVRDLTGSEYEMIAPPAPRRGRLNAAREHLRLKGMSGVREMPWLAMQRILPFGSRMLQRHSAGPILPNEWWYYSTFYTFTKIGLAYERALGKQFRFLTELRGTAEIPLKDAGRDWDDLYSFAERGDTPSQRDIERARKQLRDHLDSAKAQDEIAKTLLVRSGEVKEFFARLLPLTLLQTRALKRFLAKAKPQLIVVGNEAWEGCLLQLARAQAVPTIIVQHGILGDFYQLTEHSGDVLVVRGEFWKEFLSEESQRRSMVLNCDPPGTKAEQKNHGTDLLFAVTEYKSQAFWHSADLVDMLAAAASAAFEAKRRLVIRTHPRDSAKSYRQALDRICSELKISPEIIFSSGPGLEEAIHNSAVVLLYFSTVFLDCLRLGVPVVSPDWHDFAFKDMVRKHGVFHFARDLRDLRNLLSEGLAHKLPASSSYGQFLAETPTNSLRTFFEHRAVAEKLS